MNQEFLKQSLQQEVEHVVAVETQVLDFFIDFVVLDLVAAMVLRP